MLVFLQGNFTRRAMTELPNLIQLLSHKILNSQWKRETHKTVAYINFHSSLFIIQRLWRDNYISRVLNIENTMTMVLNKLVMQHLSYRLEGGRGQGLVNYLCMKKTFDLLNLLGEWVYWLFHQSLNLIGTVFNLTTNSMNITENLVWFW